MKINTKINLLVAVTITATLVLTLLLQVMKYRELQYYGLVEQVKGMNGHILKARIEEGKTGLSPYGGGTIYTHLDKAAAVLGGIDSALLGDASETILEIASLIGRFRSTVQRNIGNNYLLTRTMEQLLEAASAYGRTYDAMSLRVDREIADSQLYNWKGLDTRSLLELKRSSAYANNIVGEIILLVSQQLLLERNLEGFTEKYDRAIFSLGIQQENLRLQVKPLRGTPYEKVHTQLADTAQRIGTLTPELKKLLVESLAVSDQLEGYARQIDRHTDALVEVSESLRKKENRSAQMILILGQSLFFLALLLGGLLFSRSITRPLSALMAATKSLGSDSLEEMVLEELAREGTGAARPSDPPSGGDEVGVLTASFIRMKNEIRNKILLLKQSEKNLETTLNSIGDGVIATDLEGRIKRMNPTAEALTAWWEVEASGRPLSEIFHIVHSETGEVAENPVDRVLAHGTVVGVANRTTLMARDGALRKIAHNAAPIRDEKGRIGGVVLVFQDVTETYRMREAQRESEERYQKLFIDSNDTIFIASREGEILESNPAASTLLGHPVEALKEMNISRLLVNPDDRARFKKEMELVGGSVKDFEVELLTEGGKVLTCLLNATSRHDREGDLVGYQGILRDVTEGRRMERQLQQAQKIESIGTLAGGIAHDFNNILAAILGYAEMTLYKLPEESQLEPHIQEIRKAGNRARGLVKQILTFSRQAEHEHRPLQVHLVVREALKLLRASIPVTVEIRENIDARSGAIMADPTQIHQIVMNLCTNAYHAMRETGGVLAVELTRMEVGEGDPKVADLSLAPGPYIVLTVGDTGHGMRPATLDRIFEPYFTTKKKGEGTGMGLAVVHGIVKSHNGHITAYSEPGHGTSFQVYLPGIDATGAAGEKNGAGEIPGGDERILAIDDEGVVVEMEREMLECLGYKVTGTTSCEEALRLFSAKPESFDLVITDMTMPAMTGAELSRKLLAIRPDIPIIMCSGYSELINEEKARAIGIREYVMKPIVLREMAGVVRAALDQAD